MIIKKITKKKEAELKKLRAERIDKIRGSANIEPQKNAEIIYISGCGSDENDGKSPDTAIKSIEKLNKMTLKSGSYARFERGYVYRGKFKAQAGVTYTAYGEGEKPKIYGSPYNLAEYGKWEMVLPDVWRYSEKITQDVGGIVMNGGAAHGIKATLDYRKSGVYENVTRMRWTGYDSLTDDLWFWHDLGGPVTENSDGGYLYLCSKQGNPATVWRDIEILTRGNVISCDAEPDVTLNNLCIMYGGSHGIGAGTVDRLRVTECEVGWIGGSLQYYTEDGRPVRFGNGIEIYGGCKDYRIENCYVYECYDAGITHQYSAVGSNSVVMDGVYYENNVIERCVYNIEYFLGAAMSGNAPRYMRNIYIRGNLLLKAGYGWGRQRPDRRRDANIQGWDHENRLAGEFVIENNLFMESETLEISLGTAHGDYLPIIRKNTFVHGYDMPIFKIGLIPSFVSLYNEESLDKFKENEFYSIPPDKDYLPRYF